MAKPKKPVPAKKRARRGAGGRVAKAPEPQPVYRWINGRRRPVSTAG